MRLNELTVGLVIAHRRCAGEQGLELALQAGVEGRGLGFAAAILAGARRGA